MEITAKLPDDLAQHRDPGREALEALVIEGYRSGALSHYQASQLLGISRFEFDGFLKERKIFEHAYDVEDLEEIGRHYGFIARVFLADDCMTPFPPSYTLSTATPAGSSACLHAGGSMRPSFTVRYRK